MTALDLNKTNVTVAVPDVQSLSDDEYALARRRGLGASDMSTVLGVAYKCAPISEFIAQKQSDTITDAEREIKLKEAVRKGFDLEPLILQKFAKLCGGAPPLKPADMFKVDQFPFLTVNFDGVIKHNDRYVPVECKFVTTFGDKYYNRAYAVSREFGECCYSACAPLGGSGSFNMFQDYIKDRATQVGIPPYYYVQVQQQILALNSPYGYLAALHDKGWELCVYYIPRNEELINKIKIEGWKVWQQIGRETY